MHLATSTPTESRAEQILRLAQLAVTSVRDGDIHTLGLAGELDLASAGDVEAELRRVEATDAEVILVDLAGVSFIDSTGIKVLVTASARERGRNRLLLDRPSPAVLRVLRMAGVADLLPLVDPA
ncbi:MAG TPA: STAS domain-containing protein [Solirubrobacteraceae bacterium]|nr:STAS domain-containing protein [Solirubrobacteraceae bacterium]